MIKCNACGVGKATRTCPRSDQTALCGRCCAQRRNDECGECRYYREAARYHAERRSPVTPGGETPDRQVRQAVETFLALAEARRFDEAWERAEALRVRHPGNHYVAFGIGTLCAFQERHEEAVRWFDRATEIAPFFVEAHHNKGMSYRRMLDIGNAVQALRKVVELGDPSDDYVAEASAFLRSVGAAVAREYGIDLDTYVAVQAEFDRAFAHMQRREWSRALEGFRSCAARNDRHAPTHGNMAICHAAFGRKSEALAELDRALALEPNYEPAIINRRVLEGMKEGEPFDTSRAVCIDYGKLRMHGMVSDSQ